MRIEDVVVGKEYRIRQWDDMEKEFGIDIQGNIKCEFSFVKAMKDLCGKKGKVRDKNQKLLIFDFEEGVDGYGWSITSDMIETIEKNKMPIEIKPGYIVIFLEKGFEKGHITVALETSNGYVYCADKYGWYDIYEDFSDGMENEFYKIYKIYGLPKRGSKLFSLEGRKLLYDASVKKMTKSEIEKELGYKIEIVEE